MTARTYEEALLPRLDPLSLEWSRTWVRFLLRDKPTAQQVVGEVLGGPPTTAEGWPEFSRTDVELDTALMLDAVRLNGMVYYRPHLTAATLYIGDPNLWKTRAVEGTSETRRSPGEITAVWLQQGSAIDALIPFPQPAAPSASEFYGPIIDEWGVDC